MSKRNGLFYDKRQYELVFHFSQHLEWLDSSTILCSKKCAILWSVSYFDFDGKFHLILSVLLRFIEFADSSDQK